MTKRYGFPHREKASENELFKAKNDFRRKKSAIRMSSLQPFVTDLLFLDEKIRMGYNIPETR